MRVGILTVQVPFIQGGAELLARNLHAALRAAGHEADIISATCITGWRPATRRRCWRPGCST